MDCERVRDQFSSLHEGELTLAEEEKVRGHLGSCEGCRKEWEEFNQMMGWLHSVEEEEVPEGFLSEIGKKRKEREGQNRRGWVWSFPSMKIPIQAAAMVMIVFLALYLTKMTPFDMGQERNVKKPEIQPLKIEKKEPEPSPSPYQKEDLSETRPSAANEKISRKAQIAQKMKEDEKETSAPPLKGEGGVVETVHPKEMATVSAPPLEEKRREEEPAGRVKMPLAKKVTHEIRLKISDREKAFSQVEELTKGLGGAVLREDGDALVATLPVSTYGEFEKGLARLGSLPFAPRSTVQQELREDFRVASGPKSRDIKEAAPSRPMSSREDTISIRIRFIPE